MSFIMAGEGGGNIVWFTYTGADGEVIDDEATHIFVKARVIRRRAFYDHPNIVEVICDENVEKIERWAFSWCRSLRRVIMRGVKIVQESAFCNCRALKEVECDKLEIVKHFAFQLCTSLRRINLPSARIVRKGAFDCCSLTDVKFGNKLERIEEMAFCRCESLERITIPLKDGLIASDKTFVGCYNLRQVDLVDGELHKTIAALHLREWRHDMNQEIASINQILPSAAAGRWVNNFEEPDPGEKAEAVRRWIRSVLDKIIHYQAEHRHLLDDAATSLEVVLPNNDIVMNNVIPFLQLPSYTFYVNEEEGG